MNSLALHEKIRSLRKSLEDRGISPQIIREYMIGGSTTQPLPSDVIRLFTYIEISNLINDTVPSRFSPDLEHLGFKINEWMLNPNNVKLIEEDTIFDIPSIDLNTAYHQIVLLARSLYESETSRRPTINAEETEEPEPPKDAA